ncbi:hypothetical protein [Dinghuibacter silviterrae]|uniref:ATP synthase protein I n=1 Tax=Dinghuibacter silviterrae TaxID=1539049 RepID=A0A4R8DT18_9BACT|nr:hypothetical protein [Dinghuibacter silviterrae]TDX01026.1 hypothetical protein EDB95_2057 [Dinghuibacter silviterrae]
MKRFILLSLLLFVIVNGVIVLLRTRLPGWNVAVDPLEYGNAWLFVITMLAFALEVKGVRQANSYAFFRFVYTGMLLKLFLSAGVVLLYALIDRAVLSKGVVLSWLVMYIGYTGIEVKELVRAGKVKQ